ncbi:MAG: hypothetical protein HN350_00430 [Phycisphaerales bacterium]|mgnify:CR=1 FL=1|jgi:hypothetical protein|nr:hypothetical protein [Phycisphaerales bacterium]
MPNHGDTFLLANSGINNHLFIIISDPLLDPDKIVTVNLTSWDSTKDQSCIVDSGEHPFVRHKSCIRYEGDRLITAEQYDLHLSGDRLISQSPVSEELLGRILAGAAVSRHFPLGHRKILEDQRLIDGE